MFKTLFRKKQKPELINEEQTEKPFDFGSFCSISINRIVSSFTLLIFKTFKTGTAAL